MSYVISKDWDKIYTKQELVELKNMINNIYQKENVYPLIQDLFCAFQITSPQDTKVVILGQDPYPGIGQAHGLSFSMKSNQSIPRSLQNIFKELYNDLGIKRTDTDLTDWAKQGVLLLNSILTVEKDNVLSHKNVGWQKYTDRVIEHLSQSNNYIVFVLWGNYALSKKKHISTANNYILERSHPSPLSANKNFLGTNPFSEINSVLEENDLQPIYWGDKSKVKTK